MENTQPAGGPAARAPHESHPDQPGHARALPQDRPSTSAGQPRNAAGAAGTSLPRVRVSSPADVLAVVPHLLGFHPAMSLVVLGAAGPRERVELGFRYDLPDPPAAAASAEIAEHAVAVLAHHRVSSVIAVGYGPGRLVTPVADVFTAAVRRGGLRLRELLRVQDGRYWSYLCRSVTCCPPEGVAFDTSSHLASAVMTAAGLAAYPDRASRARALAPVTGEAALAMAEATARACARVATLIAEARKQRGRDTLWPVVEGGRRSVREAIQAYRDGGRLTDPDQLAWLAVTLSHLPVRDDAWARMDPEHRDEHLRLWTDLVRSSVTEWVPGPAALLAFTAWQCGDGALANMAIERALAADPGYSMALLLRDVIDAGVPPSAARVPMTPEEVAESYERQRGAGNGPGGGARRGAPGRAGGGKGTRPHR